MAVMRVLTRAGAPPYVCKQEERRLAVTHERTDDEVQETLEALGLDPLWKFYVEHNGSEGFSASDYTPMLKSFGYAIIVRVDEDDYQGDTLVLYRQKQTGAHGVLVFGWGSCSGCDALQSCGSWRAAEELRVRLYRDIKWFSTDAELLAWLRDEEVQGYKYYRGKVMFTKFREDVERALA